MIQPKKLLFVLFIFISAGTFAQNIWLNDSADVFGFEFVKPSLKGSNDGTNFFTGAYNLSFGKSVNDKSQIRIELPIAHVKVDFFGQQDSETTIGNLYFGYRTRKTTSNVFSEFGVVLPTASDDNFSAILYGVYADVNRNEMFAPDIIGITAKVNVENPINDKGLYYKIRGGLLFLRDTEYDENFSFMDFSGQFGFNSTDNVNIIAGVSGRLGLNENTELDSNGDKSTLYFGAGISYHHNNIEPGVSLRVPIDNPVKDIVNNSVAISLLFHLK